MPNQKLRYVLVSLLDNALNLGSCAHYQKVICTYHEILVQHNAKGKQHSQINFVDMESEDSFLPFYLHQNLWEVCVFPNAPSSNMTLFLPLQLDVFGLCKLRKKHLCNLLKSISVVVTSWLLFHFIFKYYILYKGFQFNCLA